MGMTIDEARTALGKERKYALHENKQAFDIAIDVMRKYQMMQADYNARLKDDMVAMLVRLNNEVDDLRAYDDIETVDKCEEIIQEKINGLKENTDGRN